MSLNLPPISEILKDVVVPSDLIKAASVATYRSQPPVRGEFTLFPMLPKELRLKIWQCALAVPRIIEMEKVPCWDTEGSKTQRAWRPDSWRYVIKNPTPLLSVCSEARVEALISYGSDDRQLDRTGNPLWIRYDHDILHLKARRWDELCNSLFHSWFQVDISYNQGFDGRYSKRRECFQHIETLAINRELFLDSHDDEAVVLPKFFPNVKLLIVLIDDGINIAKDWFMEQRPFQAYETSLKVREPWRSRWAFTVASTGPFTPVSASNARYKRYIVEQLQVRSDWVKRKHPLHVSPYIMVMGCALPFACEKCLLRSAEEDFLKDQRTLIDSNAGTVNGSCWWCR